MKNSNGNLKFSGFCADDNEFISYINNVQVDYCVLLKRKDQQFGDVIDNFEVVKNIFTVSTFGHVFARNVVTKEKYLYCNIIGDGNKKYLHNIKYPVTDEYVIVPFKELYFQKFLDSIDQSVNDMNTIYRLWNQKLVESMIETVNKENTERKARTRK